MNENRSVVNMILAGDVGGTKTLLGLFDGRDRRPRPVIVRDFTTVDYPDLPSMLRDFFADPGVRDVSVDAASFGVAGPVLGSTAQLTNVPFVIDSAAVRAAFPIPHVVLLNDLEAMAYAVPLLEGEELHVLQEGTAHPDGNIGVIAAGTGLGQALLHRVDGRLIPSPSEAGHADWAARNERDIDALRALTREYGRVEVEQIVSGRGLLNLHRVTHKSPCTVIDDIQDPNAAAEISRGALDRTCAGCVEALEMFVDAYGAEAGNLALRVVATGGLFVGGGIAPKILPAMTDGRFMRAFLAKDPFRDMLSTIPVKVILNTESGLLGAAAGAVAKTW